MVLSCNRRQTEQSGSIIMICRVTRHIIIIDPDCSVWRLLQLSTMTEHLACVSQVSDLGITVDTRLKFSTHVSRSGQCIQAHRKANLILRCFESRNISFLIAAFKTCTSCTRILFGCLELASLIKYMDKLEKVQRRFTKHLPGLIISSDSIDLT